MEVRPGYKQTEVGIVPMEWATVRLADVSAFITKGSTPTTNGFRWQSSGVLFLRSECVSPEGLDLAQSMFISAGAHRAQRRSTVQSNDLLITITGNVGRVVRVPVDFGEANINQHIARIRIVDEGMNPEWVYHFLSQPKVRQQFEKITTGQAYPQISLVQVRDAVVPRPAIAEQRATAAALSDVDALLGGLDRLIAKKRDLKQGAMQRLLTGKTRLPGFGEEWQVKQLRDVVSTPITDGPHLTPKFLADGVPFLSVNNLVNNQLDLQSLRFISKADDLEFSKKCKPRKGDILFGKAASVGMVALIETDMELNIWSPLAVIRVSRPTSARFVWYALQASHVHKQIKLLTNSSSQGNIGMGEIGLLEIPLPEPDEQAAIATVLSDMDSELFALEARRDKTRDLKQAMMQELLTGKTRLVPAGAPHA